MDFTTEQQGQARLAEMLRELAPHIEDVNCGEAAPGIPIIWPATNIRERLHDAADLIETLILKTTPPLPASPSDKRS